MKKEIMVLIMEPERIIGLELQMELESNGYSVFQALSVKHVEDFDEKQKVKVIIVNIDKVGAEDIMTVKKHLPHIEFSIIGISAGTRDIEKYEGVEFVNVFLKPFSSKSIASLIDQHCSV